MSQTFAPRPSPCVPSPRQAVRTRTHSGALALHCVSNLPTARTRASCGLCGSPDESNPSESKAPRPSCLVSRLHGKQPEPTASKAVRWRCAVHPICPLLDQGKLRVMRFRTLWSLLPLCVPTPHPNLMNDAPPIRDTLQHHPLTLTSITPPSRRSHRAMPPIPPI